MRLLNNVKQYKMSNPFFIKGNIKTVLVVVIGVIVTAVVVSAILFFTQGYFSNNVSDNISDDTWKTYQSSDGVFSFKFPSDWVWLATDDDSLSGKKRFYNVLFADKSYDDTGVARINFFAGWFKDPSIVDEKDLENSLKQEFPGSVLKETTFGGLPAYRLSIRQSESVELYVVSTVYGGLVFQVVTGVSNGSVEDRQLLSDVINSFKINSDRIK